MWVCRCLFLFVALGVTCVCVCVCAPHTPCGLDRGPAIRRSQDDAGDVKTNGTKEYHGDPLELAANPEPLWSRLPLPASSWIVPHVEVSRALLVSEQVGAAPVAKGRGGVSCG